jgi:hypothetical protein
MPLRNKYDIGKWVLGYDHAKVGDTIAWWCEYEKREMQAVVIAHSFTDSNTLICSDVDGAVHRINFYEKVTYKIGSINTQKSNGCTCGARHTSNPKYHSSWCDEGGKGD